MLQRRQLLQGALGATAVHGLAGCASGPGSAKPHVVVVGGGWGGATAAKYVRLFSEGRINVTLVEPNRQFVSCPISNLVLAGMRNMADISRGYEALSAQHGVRLVHDSVSAVDAAKKSLSLAGGSSLSYDKLVLAPGIDMLWNSVEGAAAADAQGRVLHAWKAGPQTLALRQQLEAMRDGGTYAIVIPDAPYRCPPGPYERASLVAAYFKRAKPRSKVLILDANPDVTSKPALFKKAWAELYPGMLEYRGQHKASAVDARTLTVKFDVQEDVRADVLNLLPPMRAGELAVKTGLATANNRWCPVNFQSFESSVAKDIHVVGDAIQIAPAMPKSGHMANGHGKTAAAAIVAQLSGWDINPQPMLTNTCYSFVAEHEVIHVASVHEYVAAEKTFKAVAGAGGVSAARSEAEATYAMAWARNIWTDMLG